MVPTLSEPRRDSQGFSVPPPILDPISQAQADANELSQPQFNVNIRNAPIREEGGDAALATMANTLVCSDKCVLICDVQANVR